MAILDLVSPCSLVIPAAFNSIMRSIDELHAVINKNIASTLKEHQKALKEHDLRLQVLRNERLIKLFNTKVRCL